MAVVNKRRLWNHIRGLVYGQCIGDAVGLSTEFRSKREVLATYKTMFRDRTYRHSDRFDSMHSGRWFKADFTDDSDQMFLILDSLLEEPVLRTKPAVFLTKLDSWVHRGFIEPNGTKKRAMGIGRTVYSVIEGLRDLEGRHVTMEPSRLVWEQSGRCLAANGAVMRTAIAAVPRFMSSEEVTEDVVLYAQTTHYDPRSVASCVAVGSLLGDMLRFVAGADATPLQGADIPAMVERAVSVADSWLESEKTVLPDAAAVAGGAWSGFTYEAAQRELRTYLNAASLEDLALDHEPTIGYTYKCVGSAVWCLRRLGEGEGEVAVDGKPTFVAAMCDLVQEGGDADTNGAVAGALMGCFLGYDKLVEHVGSLEWHRVRLAEEMIEPRLARLRTAMGLDE